MTNRVGFPLIRKRYSFLFISTINLIYRNSLVKKRIPEMKSHVSCSNKGNRLYAFHLGKKRLIIYRDIVCISCHFHKDKGHYVQFSGLQQLVEFSQVVELSFELLADNHRYQKNVEQKLKKCLN